MKRFIPLFLLVSPSLVFAAAKTFADLARWITGIINMVIAVMISLAVVLYFMGAVVKMQSLTHDQKALREYLLWGVLAIFIMVSIWGIVALVKNSIAI